MQFNGKEKKTSSNFPTKAAEDLRFSLAKEQPHANPHQKESKPFVFVCVCVCFAVLRNKQQKRHTDPLKYHNKQERHFYVLGIYWVKV